MKRYSEMAVVAICCGILAMAESAKQGDYANAIWMMVMAIAAYVKGKLENKP